MRHFLIKVLLPAVISVVSPRWASAEDREFDALRREALWRLDRAEREVADLRKQVEMLTRQPAARLDTSGSAETANELDQLIQAHLVSHPGGPSVTLGLPTDLAELNAGREAFEASCTQCHDAAQSMEKTKGLSDWRVTVRRMAAKPGALVAPEDIEPIAAYLASRGSAAPQATGTDADGEERALVPGRWDFFVTLAPVWRGGAHEETIEKSGFVPDTWVGVQWQSSNKPLSVRVVACVTCHKKPVMADSVSLVEGVVHFDFDRALGWSESGPRAAVEAGRFMVPFGGDSAQSNPGAMRMATKSLLFNMGQNVNRPEVGPAVLPMPYSDEGVLFRFALPMSCDLTATADFYLVNGLIGGGDGVDFYLSQDYSDNNAEPAVGGRFTIGNRFLRLGGSVMGGRFNEHSGTGPSGHELEYEIVGADITARCGDRLRVTAEYALRNSDRLLSLPGKLIDDEEVSGFSVEGELRVSPRVGLVARYDSLSHHGDLPPAGSSLTDSNFTVHRFTWGFAIALPGGSLLLVNHEHWTMPSQLDDSDIIALRWVATF